MEYVKIILKTRTGNRRIKINSTRKKEYLHKGRGIYEKIPKALQGMKRPEQLTIVKNNQAIKKRRRTITQTKKARTTKKITRNDYLSKTLPGRTTTHPIDVRTVNNITHTRPHYKHILEKKIKDHAGKDTMLQILYENRARLKEHYAIIIACDDNKERVGWISLQGALIEDMGAFICLIGRTFDSSALATELTAIAERLQRNGRTIAHTKGEQIPRTVTVKEVTATMSYA